MSMPESDHPSHYAGKSYDGAINKPVSKPASLNERLSDVCVQLDQMIDTAMSLADRLGGQVPMPTNALEGRSEMTVAPNAHSLMNLMGTHLEVLREHLNRASRSA